MTDLQSADIYWLGAHKTGTTFLQKSLDLSQRALLAAGIDYTELAVFRAAHTRPLLQGEAHGTVRPPAPVPPGRRRLVFDENIPALVQHAVTEAGLYPDIAPRARMMARHLGLDRPVLVFGVRNLGGFLPSLYCEALKSTPFRRFRRFVAAPVESLRWDDVAARLMDAFPGSPLIVYDNAGLRGNERALLAAVTGIDPAAFTLLDSAERQGFSHKAVRSLHELHRTRSVERADIQAAVRRFPRDASSRGYQPWRADELAAFDRRHADDMAALGARRGVRILDLNTAG